jgi:hypothetical protein
MQRNSETDSGATPRSVPKTDVLIGVWRAHHRNRHLPPRPRSHPGMPWPVVVSLGGLADRRLRWVRRS